MTIPQADHDFGPSIAEVYESHLVPLLFEPYARETAHRIEAAAPSRVLEVAAGTGVVTRALARRLPPSVEIVATDLNQSMLARAQATGTSRSVQWRQADAQQLPFDDETFDAVVCQFGAMFFPDKARAFAEARRVLRPGGTLLFSVWDRLEENEIPDTVTQALAARFPDDPPEFMRRTPHGYFDRDAIGRDLRDGGFTAVARFDTVAARSRADSPMVAAVAFCQGTPLRNEIVARGGGLGEVTAATADALGVRYGRGAIDGKIQATVVTISR